jgi:hypothetical protein
VDIINGFGLFGNGAYDFPPPMSHIHAERPCAGIQIPLAASVFYPDALRFDRPGEDSVKPSMENMADAHSGVLLRLKIIANFYRSLTDKIELLVSFWGMPP